MAVDVRTGGQLAVGPPHVVLSSAGRFDVDRNGQRVLVATREPGRFHVVTGWFAGLRRKTPLAK
jgi:hypothetical protein